MSKLYAIYKKLIQSIKSRDSDADRMNESERINANVVCQITCYFDIKVEEEEEEEYTVERPF